MQPEALGFATWAPSVDTLLESLPAKLERHAVWCRSHRLDAPPQNGFDVVGRVTGNEILFEPDREEATPAEIDRAIAMLEASRADVLGDVEAAPAAALDWDPPYRRFASWASWRTIRANLAHVANGETHYYLTNVGHRPRVPAAEPGGDWRRFLADHRAEAIAFLEALKQSRDRARVGGHHWHDEVEWWSVRKALRRMVRHELLHWRSIRRILASYAEEARP